MSPSLLNNSYQYTHIRKSLTGIPITLQLPLHFSVFVFLAKLLKTVVYTITISSSATTYNPTHTNANDLISLENNNKKKTSKKIPFLRITQASILSFFSHHLKQPLSRI